MGYYPLKKSMGYYPLKKSMGYYPLKKIHGLLPTKKNPWVVTHFKKIHGLLPTKKIQGLISCHGMLELQRQHNNMPKTFPET